jgi:monoamine oxidase
VSSADDRDANGGVALERLEAEVIVLGAGLAGLTAAYRLSEKGHRVIVLEARDRVGGRTWRHDFVINGQPMRIEAGGQFTATGQRELQRIAAELGVELFDVATLGDTLGYFDGRLTRAAGEAPPLNSNSAAAYHGVVELLDAMSRDFPTDAPWDADPDGELDAQTAAGWLDDNVADRDARRFLELYLQLIFGCALERVSMLHTLLCWASYRGAVDPRMRRYRFVGGAHEVSARIAARLGDRVHLRKPARTVDYSADDSLVIGGDDFVARGRRCVVAMSPADCRGIGFIPELPVDRAQLQARWHQGSGFKVQAIYDKPFWREDGLSGTCVSDLGACFVWDNSPPDAAFGVLLSFLVQVPPGSPGGVIPELFSDPEVRRTSVLEMFAKYFGPRALDPVDFLEMDWTREPFIAGCTGVAPPGLYTQFGRGLRTPVDRIHWASTETATRFIGFMNGAVQSGERVALEVGRQLRQDQVM